MSLTFTRHQAMFQVASAGQFHDDAQLAAILEPAMDLQQIGVLQLLALEQLERIATTRCTSEELTELLVRLTAKQTPLFCSRAFHTSPKPPRSSNNCNNSKPSMMAPGAKSKTPVFGITLRRRTVSKSPGMESAAPTGAFQLASATPRIAQESLLIVAELDLNTVH